MSETKKKETRPAATVVLARDTEAGMEMFMVQRHHAIDFATGALVFPGGAVDPGDREPEVRALCRGADNVSAELLPFAVAAIREAFEEAGLLLAYPTGEDRLVDAERCAALGERYRKPLESDETTIRQFAETEGLELAIDRLTHFAHWIAPDFAPKRFDTHFFVAEAPEKQIGAHDGSESVDSVWIRAQATLDEADAGQRTIIFPTRRNLEKLARHADLAGVEADARAHPPVTIQPHIEVRDDGKYLCIPTDAGYPVTEERLEIVQAEHHRKKAAGDA